MSIQSDIIPQIRGILINWLIEHHCSHLVQARSNLASGVSGKNEIQNNTSQMGIRAFNGGLLKAAGWVLDVECDVLKKLVEKYPNYTFFYWSSSWIRGDCTIDNGGGA